MTLRNIELYLPGRPDAIGLENCLVAVGFGSHLCDGIAALISFDFLNTNNK